MDVWIIFAAGAFIACVICLIVFLFLVGTWYLGDLREDRSDDPGKPYYFMELGKGASYRIMKNKFVLLRIRRENYVKQK